MLFTVIERHRDGDTAPGCGRGRKRERTAPVDRPREWAPRRRAAGEAREAAAAHRGGGEDG
ncbi:hypothetical protein HNP84_002555 [Thermocatellispora tengchongensis]|uniref:Uncharacterized protein n=1 Tax=Thermocatellispora tengchongensis TaxID=1073253 RepID=A0A840NVL7_9ACTN|nr:hypothetical protein [Thermocatellispora tengchongensis]MBB5132834.1 hypothetical protein [Thermocatellispora tengchongensis]